MNFIKFLLNSFIIFGMELKASSITFPTREECEAETAQAISELKKLVDELETVGVFSGCYEQLGEKAGAVLTAILGLNLPAGCY